MPIRNRRALVALTALSLTAGTIVSVHAAEMGFFEALFSGGRPAPQAQAQPPSPFDPFAAAYRARGRRLVRQHLRARYAALPVKIRISDRQTALDMKGGPVAALMKDETLRPGDIVVLTSGARVFTGEPDKSHTIHEFEPVQTSRFVDRQTRRQLAAMMTPRGALPADEAKRVLAGMKKGTLKGVVPVTEQVSAMRVINPWTKAE